MKPLLFIARLDKFLVLLLGTVALAAAVPARSTGAQVAGAAVFAAVAMLFFLYGARLAPGTVIAGLLHWRLQLAIFASTYVLFPVLGLALSALLRGWLDPTLASGVLFLCVLPSTVQASIAFTSAAHGNVPAAMCSASISNLLGMVLTPALTGLLLNPGGGGFNFQALENILLQLVLPFVVGQAARPFVGTWLLKHKRVTTVIDRGSILLVVYAAFSAGMVAGIWRQIDPGSLLLVLAADLVLLGAVLFINVFGSRAAGFSKEDEITIVFCGSKKSMAGGIPMATILFPGHAVGLIVLPLMLFHQAQLFACAALAQLYAHRVKSQRQGSPAALSAIEGSPE